MARTTEDPLLKTRVLRASLDPQLIVMQALRQCYSSTPVLDLSYMSEAAAGEKVVETLLKGNKGHWSPLEHAHLSLNVAYCPHDIMQQFRTHRIFSFSVQSFRYTSASFVSYENGDFDSLEKLVYIRQEGTYTNRTGKKYQVTYNDRLASLREANQSVLAYQRRLALGVAPEDARGLLPFNIRQHFVVSANLRAWLHMLDLRSKADAQPEFQQLASQVCEKLQAWTPEIYQWYADHRKGKAILSP
jgi:thymidylate synthase (FAD)